MAYLTYWKRWVDILLAKGGSFLVFNKKPQGAYFSDFGDIVNPESNLKPMLSKVHICILQ
jgi:hypothetical protein